MTQDSAFVVFHPLLFSIASSLIYTPLLIGDQPTTLLQVSLKDGTRTIVTYPILTTDRGSGIMSRDLFEIGRSCNIRTSEPHTLVIVSTYLVPATLTFVVIALHPYLRRLLLSIIYWIWIDCHSTLITCQSTLFNSAELVKLPNWSWAL